MKKEIKEELEKEESLVDEDIRKKLHENHLEAYKKYQKQLKKQIKREKALQIIMIIFIVLAIILIGIWNNKLQKDFKKSCMNLGYDENYCIAKS